MARKNPVEALEWAQRLPGKRSISAGGEAYAEWRDAQPEAATEWLNALPADDPRRETFFQTAISLLVHNPQAPAQLAAMSAPERAKARDIIQGLSSLPEDRRARLLSAVK
jgi:hypothetical protein